MIAIVTSLLFGLAASMAFVVVWLSLRSGIALGMRLLAGPELSGARAPLSARTRGHAPRSRSRGAIFPAERDRAMAVPFARPRHAAA